MSDIVYSNNIKLAVEAGTTCIELPAPPRGEVNRLAITPDSGAGTITNATLYDRQDACDGIEQSFNPDDNNLLLNEKVHRITAILTPTGGDILEFERSWAYQNQDEQRITSRFEAKIWLKLVTSGGPNEIHIGYSISVRGPLT